MRLPDTVLKTVGFLSASTTQVKYGGTGFVIATPRSDGGAFLHFVTAKHVADELGDAPFALGVNRKDGEPALIHADRVKWYFHPSEPKAVDAAVCLFAPTNYAELDLQLITEHHFALKNKMPERGMGIGDEIAVVGLFTRFWGQKRLFPIVRTGNLAMLPTERVPARNFEPMDVYLAEGRSIGGLSGSPVFIRQTVNLMLKGEDGSDIPFAGLGQLYLLGMMHGHWELPASFTKGENAEAVNMGISMIVPIDKINEIIYSPEMIAMRGEVEQELIRQYGPVADSEFGTQVTPEHAEIPIPSKDQFLDDLTKASRRVKE
jgi:hypothetical protein